MDILHLPVGPLQVNCFLLGCPDSGEAVVIDAGGDADRIAQLLDSRGWTLTRILCTHGHFDHVGGVSALKERTGAALYMHRDDLPLAQGAAQHAGKYGLTCDPCPSPDHFVEQGDRIEAGSISLEVIHTPGHSPGGICFYEKSGHLFVGDTLFADSIGRTDLPGGDHGQLIEKIRTRLFCLPDETVVYPGHGPETTLGRERRSNPFVGENA